MGGILITGGAGFIGSHAARAFACRGDRVVIIDNRSRKGTAVNLGQLHADVAGIEDYNLDIRDGDAMRRVIADVKPDAVLHLAGQVAVTWSVDNPRYDFECNALGTFNVLEAVRAGAPNACVIFSSTNKVYGGLEHEGVLLTTEGYRFKSAVHGISESSQLDFHSPYGCSKGAADQYVRDYGRIYGLRTVVARQSCIYGTHQYGIEDQGWIAWMTIAAMLDREITIYGDGHQVRDVLMVDDLIQFYMKAIAAPDSTYPAIFNVGGGPDNCLSINLLLTKLESLVGRRVRRGTNDWRPGDQRVYISDIRRAESVLGWSPRTTIDVGVEKLVRWVSDNRAIIESVLNGTNLGVGPLRVDTSRAMTS